MTKLTPRLVSSSSVPCVAALPSRRRRALSPPAAALLALVVGRPALADMLGADLAPLAAMVAQGAEELVRLGDTLNQLQRTYEETRKYAALAQATVDGFAEFSAYADTVLREPARALAAVMPEASYVNRDLRSPEAWGRGTGELQRLVRLCLLRGGACDEVREAVSAAQARDAIRQTFGTSPVTRDDVEVVDAEAAVAIGGGTAFSARATLVQTQARALMERCLGGTDAQAIAACQGAANLGGLMQLEQTAALNQQVAEANRLQALELARANAESKRTLVEAVERQAMLEAGARGMAPPRLRLTPGADEAPAAGSFVPNPSPAPELAAELEVLR